MAFSDLTREEQNLLTNFIDTLVRPTLGELARVNNHLEAVDTQYNAVASGLLGRLAGADEIPGESTGLDGAKSLTKDEVVTLVSYAQGVLTNYNTAGHRQNFSKAAGPGNLIG